MKHEQYISDKEKLAKITAVAGLGAVALTGCVGVGIYETDNETPDLATITEQTAVDLVNEYNTHPENFDESATDIVKAKSTIGQPISKICMLALLTSHRPKFTAQLTVSHNQVRKSSCIKPI